MKPSRSPALGISPVYTCMPTGSPTQPGAYPEEEIMEHVIAKLVHEFEQGKLSRRQLVQSLTIAATAAVSAPAPAAESKVITATKFNHVSYSVTDYARSRDFYAGLFGMKVTED